MKDELKEIDIKSSMCYYFENYMNIFQFMTFHTKLQWFQSHCILGLIK